MAVIRETVDAGVEQTRRQIQVRRLRRNVVQKEQELAAAVARLGQQAWEHRVEDPSYAETYAQLVTRAEQQEALGQRVADLERQVEDELAARAATEAEWKARLDEIAAEWDPVVEKLANLDVSDKLVTERFHAAERELARTQKDRETTQARVAELEHLTAVDVEQRRTRLLSRLAGLEQAIAALEAQLPDLRCAVEENTAARPPLQARLAELDERAVRTRAQKGAALGAHEIHLADLRSSIKETRTEIAALDNEIAQLGASMGPAVDKTRPAAEALQEAYAAIADIESERIDLLAQLTDLKTECEAADITAIRRFYVTTLGLLAFAALVLACLATTCLAGWVLTGTGGG